MNTYRTTEDKNHLSRSSETTEIVEQLTSSRTERGKEGQEIEAALEQAFCLILRRQHTHLKAPNFIAKAKGAHRKVCQTTAPKVLMFKEIPEEPGV